MGKRLWEDNAREKIKRSMDNGFVFVTRERNAFPQGTREAYYRFKSAGVDKLQFFLFKVHADIIDCASQNLSIF